ncbi:hypothetical protein BH09GEM1_BH09GEM1_30540 [soil metagenome]
MIGGSSGIRTIAVSTKKRAIRSADTESCNARYPSAAMTE